MFKEEKYPIDNVVDSIYTKDFMPSTRGDNRVRDHRHNVDTADTAALSTANSFVRDTKDRNNTYWRE